MYRLLKLSREIYAATEDEFYSTLALANELIIIVFIVAMFYNEAFAIPSLSYPFWLLQGFMQRIHNDLTLEGA